MSSTDAVTAYYDPYDVDINRDPYPTFRRLRDEAPVYYNDVHDFWALSRFEDIDRALRDHETFISGPRRHPRTDQGGHRDAAGHPHLRGPAHPHGAPRAAVAGLHPEEGRRARAQIREFCVEVPRSARR